MSEQLVSLVQKFTGLRILVIGEATSDIDLAGTSNSVAREAPVPVVRVSHIKRVPGRAANAAVNAAQLGAKTTFLSVIGDDAEGKMLREVLGQQEVDTRHILVERGRQTQTVQRVLAGGHLLVRFDFGSEDTLRPATEARFIKRLRSLYPQYDAVLVSDYGYGVLSDAVVEALAELRSQYDIPLIIDSKRLDKYRQVRPLAVKPNYQEALRLLGITEEMRTGRASQLWEYRQKLFRLTGASHALVTLDVEGAVVLDKRSDRPYRTYSKPVENSKAVGAGDTYSAALTMALAMGAPIAAAAEVAQAAATLVVQKAGTVPCSNDELVRYFSVDPKYFRSSEELKDYVTTLRSKGLRVVFTNGCFDILHSGHVAYLNQARAQGDVLIVGVNSDASVRRLKGSERPLNSLDDRARVLSGLSAVDAIVPFEEDTPHKLIEVIRPDVYVKGGDYDRESLPETPLVERLGGEVAIMPFVIGRSTTNLISRIRSVAETVTGGTSHAEKRHLGQVY